MPAPIFAAQITIAIMEDLPYLTVFPQILSRKFKGQALENFPVNQKAMRGSAICGRTTYYTETQKLFN
jgi:hypothetical protein